MSQDIRDFVSASCDLLALGEPTHQEPAFGLVRNELFGQLAERGFRSIALESDRVAGLVVNDFVAGGSGSLDEVMSEGFSHRFGELDANRRLVAWMRRSNEGRPAGERLSFHGFDAPLENMSAPSPRRYLEYARDYLGLDIDIAGLAGDDERWSRTEAVLDPSASPGDTAEAARLRVVADDMLVSLYARAPEKIAETSRDAWYRAKIHLTAGIGLLRYHRRSAEPLDPSARVSGLGAVRDVLMTENLLDIRVTEGGRGPTLVFGHNTHLQRHETRMAAGDMKLRWFGTGSILSPMLAERYTFVASSLGRSAAISLGEPDAETFEGGLQAKVATWGLLPAGAVAAGRVRTDTTPRQGYFGLDEELLASADVVLHIHDGAASG